MLEAAYNSLIKSTYCYADAVGLSGSLRIVLITYREN
jgi:hypothetical protein